MDSTSAYNRRLNILFAGPHSMDAEQSQARWIDQLRSGDSRAAQRLWDLYFQKMVEFARRRLNGAPRGAADEEDVALSAFKSFWRGAREGRFSSVDDRTSLWPLLVAITANKAVDLIRLENRNKRGGPRPAAGEGGRRQTRIPLHEILATEPTPEFAAQMNEEFRDLLERLHETGDPNLPQIALWKIEGDSNREIAQKLRCAQRTVERKLRIIATLWNREGLP